MYKIFEYKKKQLEEVKRIFDKRGMHSSYIVKTTGYGLNKFGAGWSKQAPFLGTESPQAARETLLEQEEDKHGGSSKRKTKTCCA